MCVCVYACVCATYQYISRNIECENRRRWSGHLAFQRVCVCVCVCVTMLRTFLPGASLLQTAAGLRVATARCAVLVYVG